ncbi:fungal pheromone STE3G-protein-coupled receptor, partial [Rickenella mellea]
NTGIILYSLWVSIACLNQFINSVIWHNNALNSAPVWCDISTRLIVGISVAIPASSLCIVRRLYHICSM